MTILAQNLLSKPAQSQSATLDMLYKLSGFIKKQRDSDSTDALLWAQAFDVLLLLGERVVAQHDALTNLVERCDGQEGIRADGSNIDTLEAHAALGDLDQHPEA